MAAWSATAGAQGVSGTGGKARALAKPVTAVPAAGAVVVAPDVLDGWSFLYRHIDEVEFVLCLEGRGERDVVHIHGFRLARIERTSSSSVRYQPCSGREYVGTAHNHPPVEGEGSLCYRSTTDRQSFDQDDRAIIDVILCGPDQYIWILRNGAVGGPGREAPG
ncbi:MAG: hypothetical protein HYY94_05755 [Gemmatimonadetes bacterium]|nr:hypothetical protein [Gemmatimonadota bacterium]